MIDTKVINRIVRAYLICDKCKQVIQVNNGETQDTAVDGLNSSKYRDQNWGHECEKCKTRRHRAYDIYVTSIQRDDT